MNFIDIHNHFAWDIDDGMESKEQAILALEGAKRWSTSYYIYTAFYSRKTR